MARLYMAIESDPHKKSRESDYNLSSNQSRRVRFSQRQSNSLISVLTSNSESETAQNAAQKKSDKMFCF